MNKHILIICGGLTKHNPKKSRQTTEIIINAPVVVKSNLIEIPQRGNVRKSGHRSRWCRNCRRLVALIRRYFTFVFCCENFSVNRFRFRINNKSWSDRSEIRMPETCLFGWVINILSMQVAI